jgi:hypothetical protein
VHTATGELATFPTAIKVFFFATIEMLAPLFIHTARVPASGTSFVLIADTARQSAIRKSLITIHFSSLPAFLFLLF